MWAARARAQNPRPSPASSTSAPEPRLYEDPDGLFSLHYPSAWTLRTTNRVGVVGFVPRDQTAGGGLGIVSTHYEPDGFGSQSYEEFSEGFGDPDEVALFAESLRETSPPEYVATYVSHEPAQLAGQDALLVFVQLQGRGAESGVRKVYMASYTTGLPGGSGKFALNCFGADLSKSRALCAQFAGALTFGPRAASRP